MADPQFESIRRGADGRLKIQARGKGRWSLTSENRFFAVLRESGNITASTRAAGVSREAVWKRREAWPAFARRMEQTLDEAEVSLEFRVACLGTNWTEDTGARDEDEAEEIEMAPQPFDHEFALRFLKWREEKRRGGGKSGERYYRRKTLDEVHESILGKLSAIARHHKLFL